MTVMESGTTYEKDKTAKISARRFHECKQCHDKVYTKEYNSQESVGNALDKCRKIQHIKKRGVLIWNRQ